MLHDKQNNLKYATPVPPESVKRSQRNDAQRFSLITVPAISTIGGELHKIGDREREPRHVYSQSNFPHRPLDTLPMSLSCAQKGQRGGATLLIDLLGLRIHHTHRD